MRKKFYGLLVICIMLGFSACDDYWDDIKAAGTEYDQPKLEAYFYSLDKTIVIFRMPNFRNVESSHGSAILYTGHYVEGEHSKIPTEGVTEFPLLFCGASKKASYKFSSFTGKYTFWVTGKYIPSGAGKTEPSNVVALDFVE